MPKVSRVPLVNAAWPPVCEVCGKRGIGRTFRKDSNLVRYECYWCNDPDEQALLVTKFCWYRHDLDAVRRLEVEQQQRESVAIAERKAREAKAERARKKFWIEQKQKA